MAIRRKPLSTKTAVSRALDLVERQICLKLAGHKCEACGFGKTLSWCHIVPRGRKALRWDRNNSIILCGRKGIDGESSCHYHLDNLMTDRQRYRFVNKLRPDVYDHLDAQIGLKFELTLKQMLHLLAEKKKELEEIKNGEQ